MAKGIDNGVIASLGKQLTNKVESGAVTRKQANKTAGQRKLLQKAFGDNWRVKVYGKGGAKALPSYGYAGGSEVNQLRSKALKRAKAKLNVGRPDKTTLNHHAGSPGNGSVEAPPKALWQGREKI
jgi:hypothetical protein